jgi:hypothetical protein
MVSITAIEEKTSIGGPKGYGKGRNGKPKKIGY